MRTLLRSFIVRGLSVCCLLLLSGCVAGSFYYPDRDVYGSANRVLPPKEDVEFYAEDGTGLHGWFFRSRGDGETKGTIVFFHGNAQNLTSHVYGAEWLVRAGYNVFIFDYRGYGRSEGSPDQKGVYLDSVAAVRYVMLREDVDAERVVLFGQSLGGVQAIAVMSDPVSDEVRGVVVEAPFYSYSLRVADALEGVWFIRWIRGPLSHVLISDRYAASKTVAAISPRPVMFMHGEADRVIEASHSIRLHDEAKEPKFLWTPKRAGHLELHRQYGEIYEKRVLSFLDSCLERPQRRSR